MVELPRKGTLRVALGLPRDQSFILELLAKEKQRRGFSEYAHAMRHGKWPKNKRRPAQQSERQAERTALSGLGKDTLADPGFDPGVMRRPTIGNKWTGAALGEWIEKKKDDRAARAGGKKRRAARKSIR